MDGARGQDGVNPALAFDRIVEHVHGLTCGDVPAPAREAARNVFLDTLGVVVGAYRQPIARKLEAYLELSAESGGSTAVCGFRKVSATTAAFANGAISHDLELDDYHQTSALHAGAVLVPAALAVGEDTDATAEDVDLALIGGYEIACGLARMMDADRVYEAGFHPTTVLGVVGAAAVAGLLMRLTLTELREACRLAMSLMSGIMACKTEPDHYTKSYQCGISARNGVIAAQMVAQGRPFSRADGGLLAAIVSAYARGEARPPAGEPGAAYEITQTGYKLYACCRHIHPLLDALADIRREARIDDGTVETMRLNLYARGAVNVGDHTLRTHNARYVMAMALRHGVLRREFFTEAFGIDAVRPVMDQIELVADEALQKAWPEKTPGIVTVRTRAGQTYVRRVDHPKGGPENPARAEELREKFAALVAPVIGAGRTAAVARMLAAGSFRLRELTGHLAAA